MGTTTSSASSIFTGSSQFSSDLQQVVTRAVNIASLPITQLNNDLTNLQNQSTALTGLDSKFTALQTSLQGIEDAVSGNSFQASLTNPDGSTASAVSASLSDGATEGNYSIEVLDAGAYSTSLTTNTWVDAANPKGQTHTYQLWVGSTSNPANEIDINPADNSAQSVAAAINAAAGDKVRAIAVNVGSEGQDDWRISLQSTSLGNIPVDIQDGGVSLQKQTAGRVAQYVVNNSGVTATSSSRSIQISSGLTVDLLASAPGKPINITVTRPTSGLSTAVGAFATAYNAVVDALDAQRGQTKGAALGGDSIVYTLTQALSSLGTYSSSNSQLGLMDLGLELGKDGHLTFTAMTLMGTDFGNSAQVTSFFGNTTDGGFLKFANDTLTSLEDSTTGILKGAETNVQSQITDTQNQITTKTAQVAQLQQTLSNQMATADAAIASMEQQYSYISSMFQAQQVADEQYK